MRQVDEEQAERLVNTYSDLILRLSYTYLHSAQDAEDICQEVFLELVSRNPTFPTENARRAWLIRVTVNKSNSLWRTLWRRRVELREKVEVAAAQSDEASALADALAALSEDDRMLIHLFYYEGLKSGEIAGILKRRPDAVRKQLSRARARMKRILSGEGFE